MNSTPLRPGTRTHNLLELFDALPATVQDAVEHEYDARQGGAHPEQPTAIEILITPGDAEPTDAEAAAAQGNIRRAQTYAPSLGGERDAFRTWRYLHEADGSRQAYFRRVDYGRLGAIANALQAQFRGVLRPNGKGCPATWCSAQDRSSKASRGLRLSRLAVGQK